MAGVVARIGPAAAAHREAVATATAVANVAAGYGAGGLTPTAERGIRELAERLRVAAALLAPGWLGSPLDAVPPSTPLGVADRPEMIRIGAAYPLDDASFPVVVPLGHVAVDGDARDPRVAGMLRAMLLRLLATCRAGATRVLAVDASGGVFDAFTPLREAGIMPAPVADRAGLCAVLSEAERWVRERPAGTLLLLIASWPQETDPVELARVSALASEGPAAGLHLLLAGWPPLLLGEDATEPVVLPTGEPITLGRLGPPLPHATRITLRNPYALVGDPPGGRFSASVPAGAPASDGLNARVFLDDPPPADLIARVCQEVAVTARDQARSGLPGWPVDGPYFTEDVADGLTVLVGHAGSTPVTLRLGGASPHWLVVGESGAGRTALLLYLLYGLALRYRPDQLACHLITDRPEGPFADLVPGPGDPSCLPQLREVATGPAEGAAALRRLAAAVAEGGSGGIRRVIVVDGDVPPPDATEALATLAASGGAAGVHLILAGRDLPPEPVASRCRVRIALPGGAAALDRANHAADELAAGTAVVNTAGGLGGPAGASRAHEQVVRFPDPYAQRVALAGLRYRLWRAAGGGP